MTTAVSFFDAAATADALPFEQLIPALRTLFAAGCEVPARHVHRIAAADGAELTSLIMPAWLPGRHYGVKTVNIAPANAARGLQGLFSTYVLYDATTGAPLAWIDGNQITSRRTAARGGVMRTPKVLAMPRRVRACPGASSPIITCVRRVL